MVVSRIRPIHGRARKWPMNMATIAPEELDRMRRRGEAVELIDVRTPVEYRQVHAEPARLVPLDRLDPRAVMESRAGVGDHPLYLICRSGSRSRQAAERFHRAGYPHVVNVEGGNAGLGAGGASGGPGRESDVAGTSGPGRRRVARGARVFAGGPGASGLPRAGGFRRGGPGVRRGSRTPAGWEWSSPGCPGTARRRPSTGVPAEEDAQPAS